MNVSKIALYLLFFTLIIFYSCKKQIQESKNPPVKVDFMVADSVFGDLTHTFVGEIEENMSVSVSFPIGGKVEKVYVHEGDNVQAGQLIAKINSENAINAYNSAKASLKQAEDAYDRLKIVHDQGSLAEVKWVEILTTLEQARSLEQIAKKQLEDCTITAPISGIIGTCNAKVGSNLLPSEPAVTILDVSNVDVTFSVPESEISSIQIGNEAFVYVSALDNQVFQGKISEKSIISSKISHSYKVKITFPKKYPELIPGMICKIKLNKPNQNGFVIPAKCVQTRPEGLSVWVIENGKAQHRIITSYEFVDNGVLVNSGINSGDTIVTAGMQKLYLNVICTFDE